MIEAIKQYPQLFLLLILLIGLAVAVIIIAQKSRAKIGDSPETLLSAKDVGTLKEAFAVITEEKLRTVHGRELVFAVVTNIERKLDDGVQFEDFTQPQRNVYALWHFVQAISGRKMCDFFREFTSPLTETLTEAVVAINEAELAGIITDAYNAFDDNNESASCDKKTTDALNAAFEGAFDRNAYYDSCEKYILENIDAFVDKA